MFPMTPLCLDLAQALDLSLKLLTQMFWNCFKKLLETSAYILSSCQRIQNRTTAEPMYNLTDHTQKVLIVCVLLQLLIYIRISDLLMLNDNIKSRVQFLVRAHTWVGSITGWGTYGRQPINVSLSHKCFSLSLSLSSISISLGEEIHIYIYI